MTPAHEFAMFTASGERYSSRHGVALARAVDAARAALKEDA